MLFFIGYSYAEQEQEKLFKTYLDHFYPRALAVRNAFVDQSTPEKIAVVFKELIDVIAERPWFYLFNHKTSFQLKHYWEFYVDQLFLLNDYLKRAYVHRTTKKVCLLNVRNFAFSTIAVLGKYQKLLDYYKEHPHGEIYDFFALCFDFVIKLFNECILFQEYKKATLYVHDMEYFVATLKGSFYEQQYQESLKIAQELLMILKQKKADVAPKTNELLAYYQELL
jgi:hypothetical protein